MHFEIQVLLEKVIKDDKENNRFQFQVQNGTKKCKRKLDGALQNSTKKERKERKTERRKDREKDRNKDREKKKKKEQKCKIFVFKKT